MHTLKLPVWEDEYDASLDKHLTGVRILATPLWMRRLGGPEDTRPTEVTYYRGLFPSATNPRRCITVAVAAVALDPVPATGAGFGVFHVQHAALDAANQKTEGNEQ